MSSSPWRQWFHRLLHHGKRTVDRRPSFRPRLEALEPRWVPAITATGQSFSLTEGITGTAVVATFTDTDPSRAANYTVTLTWTDGTTPGTVSFVGGGTYSVTGTHFYAEDTTPLPVGVSIQETTPGDTDSATTTASVTVAEAPFLMAGTTLTGFEFTPLVNVPVATFTHGSGTEPASVFPTVDIDWGDGSPHSGATNIVQSNGAYTILGSHTYTEESTGSTFPNQAYQVTVTVPGPFDPRRIGGGDDFFHATATGTATILEELLPGSQRGTPTQRFVSETYRDLLQRPLDQVGLNGWGAQLDALVAQGMSVDQAQRTVVFRIETEEDMVRLDGAQRLRGMA